jgi:hypothetical protein
VARENSSVEARENSSVVARENSSVEAWGNSSVVARGNVGVHVQSPYCSLELFAFSVAWLIAKCKVKTHGKKCQTITPVAPEGLEGWFENEAVSVDGKKAILFKRVSADFKTQEGQTNETLWAVGSTLEHKAWSPKDDECGPGKFHACSRPYFCDEFRSLRGDRYVAIEVNVSDLYLWPNGQHPHKIAFRKGTVLHECNKLGKKIA